MEGNPRKGWFLLGFVLFFLFFISLAVPANEKEDKFDTPASMKLTTEKKQNKVTNLDKNNKITDNPEDDSTFPGEKLILRRNKHPARLLPFHLL